MSRIISTIFLGLICLSCFALDNSGRLRLAQLRSGSSDAVKAMNIQDEPFYISAIIEIESDDVVEELEMRGVVIAYRRQNLLLAYVPADVLSEVDLINHVKRSSVGFSSMPSLDFALPATNADRVLEGENLPSEYSGKGVVVGFSDIGFDPGHAAFEGRVKKVVHVVDSTASIIRAETQSEISSWTTDNDDDLHATHVAGILAGYDNGSIYNGLARGAEIVGTTSNMDDVSILVGVEEVIGYAKENGKPAVVNLSLGSTTGPHDGTDLMSRYLDLCADDAAIVLSAGNNGDTRVHASKELRDNDVVASVMIESFYWSNILKFQGYVDVWSDNESAMKTRIRVWDRYLNEIVWEGEWREFSEDDTDRVFSGETDTEFERMFEGEIVCAGELSKANNRQNITYLVDLTCKEPFPGYTWERHSIVLDFESKPGTKLEFYSQGNIGFYEASDVYSWVSGGNSEQTVSSMACGYKTICVGAATTRDATPLIYGGKKSWYPFVEKGTVSQFSSYGTTFDGRQLPHLCAPGSYVVSAANRWYLIKNPSEMNLVSYESPSNPGHYYYPQCGTSMSAPHVAGIFAMWLEADPTLSGVELREIAMKTARFEGVSFDNPRTGAGMIDARAGLEYILDKAGVDDVLEDDIKIWRSPSGGLSLTGCDISKTFVEVYSLSGVKLAQGNCESVKLPDIPLIIRVVAPGMCVTKKLM